MNMNFLDDAGLANSTAFGDVPFAVESYGVQESEKELADAALACIEIDQTLENATGAVTAMESLHAVAVASVADGRGLGEHGAAALLQGADCALGMIGASGGMQMYAAESYGSNSGFATHAMESFSETMEKIWDTIVEWWNKAKEAVIKWFQKHISSLGRLKIAAEALGEKAEKSDNSPKEKKLEFSKAKYITVGDSLAKTAEVSLLEDLNEISDKVISKEAISETAEEFIEISEASVKAIGKIDITEATPAEFDTLILTTALEASRASVVYSDGLDKLLGLDALENDAPNGDKRIKIPKKKEAAISERMCGNALWYIDRYTNSEDGTVFPKLKFYGTDPAKFKDKDDHEVDALTGGEISEVCERIVDGIEFLQRRDPFKKLSSDTKKLTKIGKEVQKASISLVRGVKVRTPGGVTTTTEEIRVTVEKTHSTKSDVSKLKKALKTLTGSFNIITDNARTPVREYIQHVSTVMGAYYSFCSMSYSNLKPDDS